MQTLGAGCVAFVFKWCYNEKVFKKTIDFYLALKCKMQEKGGVLMKIKTVCERTGLTDRTILMKESYYLRLRKTTWEENHSTSQRKMCYNCRTLPC